MGFAMDGPSRRNRKLDPRRRSGGLRSVSGRVRTVTPPPDGSRSPGEMDPFQAVPSEVSDELEALRDEAQTLKRLQEVIHFLNGAPDLNTLRQELLDLAISVSGLRRGMLALRAPSDDEGGSRRFKIKATRGFEESKVRGSPEAKVLRGIVNRTLEARETLLEGCIRDDGILGHAAGGKKLALGAVACLPLDCNGELVGALLLDDPDRERPFSTAEISLLRSFARHAALALHRVTENSRLRRRVELLKRRNERLEAEHEHLSKKVKKAKKLHQAAEERLEVEERNSERLKRQASELRHTSERLAAIVETPPNPKSDMHGRALRRLLGASYADAKREFTRRYLTNVMREAQGDLRAASDLTRLPISRLIGLLHHLDINEPPRPVQAPPRVAPESARLDPPPPPPPLPGWGDGVRS